jgi:TatD DNase family protein
MGKAWIDSHVHLDAKEYASDVKSVRDKARQMGVSSCVIPSVEKDNFKSVRDLAHALGDFYALGIHPMYTPGAQDEDLKVLEDMIAQATRTPKDPRLLAVGEIGLDGFVEGLDFQRQHHFYVEQLKMANRHRLPLILHVRKSADPLLKELRRLSSQGGIAHAFNGSLQQAQSFIDQGFCLGFGGALTFERASQLRKILKWAPKSAIVLETDGPDIPPQWLYVRAKERANGHLQMRNEPAEIAQIARVVSDILGVGLQALSELTSENVSRVLRMPNLTELHESTPITFETQS